MTSATLGLQVRLFLVAVQFYTRLPVTGRLAAWVGWQPEWVARATRYFPLVGALVGLLIAFVYAMAGGFLPHGVAVLIATGAGLLLTGARHEGGFADFCDGFGGQAGRGPTLAAMHDPRVGAHGAVGVAMLLLGRFETLASLDPEWIASAFVVGHALSRGCAVAVMASLPYVRDGGTRADAGFAGNCAGSTLAGSTLAGAMAASPGNAGPAATGSDATSRAAPDSTVAGSAAFGAFPAGSAPTRPPFAGLTAIDAGVALATAVLPVVGVALWTGDPGKFMIGTLCAVAVTLWLRRAMRKRLGGYTGSCLGAVQQAAELAFYVGLLGGLVLASEALGDPTT